MFWIAGCSLLRAKDFSCSLDALYGGLWISKNQILQKCTSEKKICQFCSQQYIFAIFYHQNQGSGSGSVFTLKCWIRIRIGNLWIRIRNTACKFKQSKKLLSKLNTKYIWKKTINNSKIPTLSLSYLSSIPTVSTARLRSLTWRSFFKAARTHLAATLEYCT